jgi:hypothetical protein
MFKKEYENLNILNSVGSIIPFLSSNNAAPVLLIGVVILLALGYIIQLFGFTALFKNESIQSVSNYTNKSSYLTPNSQSANYTMNRNMNRSANQYNTTAYKSAFNRAL